MDRTKYRREYYLKNKDKMAVQQKTAGHKRFLVRKKILATAKSVPCADCGNVYPPHVMDFDHLRDKTLNVSHMVTYSIKRLTDEIAKCEVVCANCHRERTFRRGRIAA